MADPPLGRVDVGSSLKEFRGTGLTRGGAQTRGVLSGEKIFRQQYSLQNSCHEKSKGIRGIIHSRGRRAELVRIWVSGANFACFLGVWLSAGYPISLSLGSLINVVNNSTRLCVCSMMSCV